MCSAAILNHLSFTFNMIKLEWRAGLMADSEIFMLLKTWFPSIERKGYSFAAPRMMKCENEKKN